MQMPEDNYIEDPDILADTQFPILYELYTKVEKSTIDNVAIE